MSRIGVKPIPLPKGVRVEVKEKEILVEGPLGKLTLPLFEGITVEEKDGKLQVHRHGESKDMKAKHGLTRALLANHVSGTVQGFSKILVLQGVGYRAQKRGRELVLSLGFSHEVVYPEPSDVKIEVIDPTKIKVSGIDKQRVGQIAAEIRAFKKPEPYKGKGIKYEDEVIRRKAGKTGKK
ncbi:MAG: 50S ribosomal protein L6 [Leptospiraceae bacterium]|nr:50S ribosomal protein L6 [Leptospiraceae bacterium]MDW8306067.1 50S ribosomal protein L6 [Leptospiraceae bacterium]